MLATEVCYGHNDACYNLLHVFSTGFHILIYKLDSLNISLNMRGKLSPVPVVETPWMATAKLICFSNL